MPPKKVAAPRQQAISFVAYGAPRPKGSKSAVRRGRRIILIEGTLGGKTKDERARASERVRETYAWFENVELAAMFARVATIDGPVQVVGRFFFACPKSRTPGDFHVVKPDLDKLLRGVFDPLTKASVIVDDSRVVNVDGSGKWYCMPGESPRAEIEVIPLQRAR